MSQEIPASTRLNENVFHAISYGLITLMVICGVLTFGNLVTQFISIWPTTAMAIVSALIMLDRLYTYQKLKPFSFLSEEWLLPVVSQWIVIIVVIKVISGLANGVSIFLGEVPLWASNFQEHFLTADFLVSMGVAAIVWVLGGNFAEILNAMGMKQALIDRQVKVSAAESPPRYRLVSLVFNTGAFLVVITALTRINLQAFFLGEKASILVSIPALEGGGASTLLYFMFGLGLLSLTQFAYLNTRWVLAGIRVERNLAASWAFYSFLFLIVLALIAGFLPTSYGLGVLALLKYWLNVLIASLIYLVRLLLLLFILLISLPFRQLDLEKPLEKVTITMPEFPDVPPEVASPVTPVAWWEMLKTILIWVVAIVIMLYAIRQYLQQHENLTKSLRKRPVLRWLLQVWIWLKNLFDGIRKGVVEMVAANLERIHDRRTEIKESGWSGFINPRRLDPRQRVYFFYLGLVRRGNESGLTRSLSQTPYEYASTLNEALPDVDEDVDALTQAFVEARYTPQVVEEQKANLVKTYWDRIRRALRSKREREKKAEKPNSLR